MARGGRRTGTPGTAYPNRADLRTTQPARAVQGQTYGTAGAQLAAQHQMPLQQIPATTTPGPSTPPTASAPAGPLALGGGPAPGELGTLHAPTQRPNEHVMTGVASGPGASPSADDQLLGSMRGLYNVAPSSDLARLIASLEAKGR